MQWHAIPRSRVGLGFNPQAVTRWGSILAGLETHRTEHEPGIVRRRDDKHLSSLRDWGTCVLSADDLGLKTQGFRLPSLRDWRCVRGMEQPRSGDSCQPRVFQPEVSSVTPLTRQAAERRQVS
ncbi:hypothetical protein RISK_006176 [Rhodopirellula islandica]|uniref:Uncharacterized protein n=1 Tax=Rhodopirellula islandica TaxID=595434 RepID=A0A0J1B5L1_RHOIS|nr:hypothetical protein RISK_006176 [Rhodopirellula islandica]